MEISLELGVFVVVCGLIGVILGIYAISEGVALGKHKYDERKEKGEY
jgi:hypothetical protein